MKIFRCPKCGKEILSIAVEVSHRCPKTGDRVRLELIGEEPEDGLAEET